VIERSPRRQAVGSNPTSPIPSDCGKSSGARRGEHRNPKKTGVWHKRLYTVIVEIPLFPCIPLSRS
jgi:hypothetical protein